MDAAAPRGEPEPSRVVLHNPQNIAVRKAAPRPSEPIRSGAAGLAVDAVQIAFSARPYVSLPILVGRGDIVCPVVVLLPVMRPFPMKRRVGGKTDDPSAVGALVLWGKVWGVRLISRLYWAQSTG